MLQLSTNQFNPTMQNRAPRLRREKYKCNNFNELKSKVSGFIKHDYML